MIYRQAERVDLDLEARERDALVELGRRRDRLKTRWISLGIVLGFLVGTALLGLLPEPAERRDARGVGYLVALVLTGAVVLLGLASAAWARRLARRRAPAWLAEVAGRHHVPPERLVEVLRAIDTL